MYGERVLSGKTNQENIPIYTNQGALKEAKLYISATWRISRTAGQFIGKR